MYQYISKIKCISTFYLRTGVLQQTATATKRAMATATVMMVVGDEEGNGDGNKSNANGNKGGWGATAIRAIVTRVVGEQR